MSGIPGLAVRACPVCKRDARSHREPVSDQRDEIVFYHQHRDGRGGECEMSGRVAALRAVAFTIKQAA